ncbi:hypothetical protein INR75_03905 [Zunongwangia sp. SCSIO 43204]|uniref:hypothetical protein n=1 Tax=Zunongwangia sp. SCSIO 43204 TaxID=2779359 RepID=UPI001CA7D8D4|nr:hypothetical protein [Zunongwangia sp. SCSIO 43204]UAB85180.1 hypothetical protein INR75_03905 [Zunongwangia sp. SCSIO 43204]
MKFVSRDPTVKLGYELGYEIGAFLGKITPYTLILLALYFVFKYFLESRRN